MHTKDNNASKSTVSRRFREFTGYYDTVFIEGGKLIAYQKREFTTNDSTKSLEKHALQILR